MRRRCSAATSTASSRGATTVLDGRSALFPLDRLDQLRPGTYAVQAVLHRNLDLNHANAPGDLYGPVRTVRIDPAAGGVVALELSHALPEETLPPDTELVKHIKIRSRVLERVPRPADRPARRRDPAPRLRAAARPQSIRCGCTSAATAGGTPASTA